MNTLDRIVVKPHEFTQALWGSLFITLCSLVWIPTLPIAITLQSMSVFVLALVQPPRVCLASILVYLLEATLGLPVLCGYSNSFWIIGTSAGYLVAFPLAGYVTSLLAVRMGSLKGELLGIFSGQALIYALGFMWLAKFIGFSQAFLWGVVFFIPSALLQSVLAIAAARLIKRQNSFLLNIL